MLGPNIGNNSKYAKADQQVDHISVVPKAENAKTKFSQDWIDWKALKAIDTNSRLVPLEVIA